MDSLEVVEEDVPIKKRKTEPIKDGGSCQNSDEPNNSEGQARLDHDVGVLVSNGASSSLSEEESSASESDWQPPSNGAISWIYEQIQAGTDPRDIIKKLLPSLENDLPSEINTFALWKLVLRLLSDPAPRVRLENVNTLADAIGLIKTCQRILVLTGAGVSVSCGIPDFRSRDGVYARLAVDFPDLPSPESMFDIAYFRQDPRPFFKFAKEIYPGQFKPSLIHKFIAKLDGTSKLLRNYTQNIDTLEQVAGIKNVIQCHGSFATATCQTCKFQTDSESIREDIFKQVIPRCPRCTGEEPGILKPDIVFFGENLPEHFHRQMTLDKDEADLLIVIGSALKVRPVALIPNSLPASLPQILINREPLSHMAFDVELLGDGDTVVSEICRHLGPDFGSLVGNTESLNEVTSLPEKSPSPKAIGDATLDDSKSSKDSSNVEGVSGEGRPLYKDEKMVHVITNGDVDSDDHKSREDISGESPKLECDNGVTFSKTGNPRADNNKQLTQSCENLHTNHKPDHECHDQKQELVNSSTGIHHDREVLVHGENVRDQVGNNSHSPSNSRGDTTGHHEDDTVRNHGVENDGSVPKENTDDTPCTSGSLQTSPEANGDVMRDVIGGSGVEERDQMSMEGFWKSRWKQSVSKRLPAGCYFYDGKRRYIFPGAEIPPEEVSDSSDDEDDTSSSSSNHEPASGHIQEEPCTSDQSSQDTPSGQVFAANVENEAQP